MQSGLASRRRAISSLRGTFPRRLRSFTRHGVPIGLEIEELHHTGLQFAGPILIIFFREAWCELSAGEIS